MRARFANAVRRDGGMSKPSLSRTTISLAPNYNTQQAEVPRGHLFPPVVCLYQRGAVVHLDKAGALRVLGNFALVVHIFG